MTILFEQILNVGLRGVKKNDEELWMESNA